MVISSQYQMIWDPRFLSAEETVSMTHLTQWPRAPITEVVCIFIKIREAHPNSPQYTFDDSSRYTFDNSSEYIFPVKI